MDGGICKVDTTRQDQNGDVREVGRGRNSLEERLVGMEEGQSVGREGWWKGRVEDLDDGCPEAGVEAEVIRDETVDEEAAAETETDGERVGLVDVWSEGIDTERDEGRDIHSSS